MTTFRKVTMHHEEDGESYSEILVLPDCTTTDQIMLDPENAEIVCECTSEEGADLIVDLLNRHYAKLGVN
jgi:hypothetical protein